MKSFKPTNIDKAVAHRRSWGPSFSGRSVFVERDPMNGYHNAGCRTNGKGSDYFNIPTDDLREARYN